MLKLWPLESSGNVPSAMPRDCGTGSLPSEVRNEQQNGSDRGRAVDLRRRAEQFEQPDLRRLPDLA